MSDCSTVDKNIDATMRLKEQTVMNEILNGTILHFSSTEALGGSGRGTQVTACICECDVCVYLNLELGTILVRGS